MESSLPKPAKLLRVLIAGGGTGGHIYPGIAIAREIKRRHPAADLLFVGTERGMEMKIVPAEGFRLETIMISGLKGTGPLKQLKSLLAVPKSLLDARSILRRFQPTVVVGVGGYSSGPPVLMAALMGIPAMLQEQNALPGLTNRLLARVARKVATAFRECEAYFGSKAVLTGNPVRAEFSQVPGRTGSDPFTLLVFGGSQGAQPLNQSVIEALAILEPQLPEVQVIHQTGERDYSRIKQAYEAMRVDAEVRSFFEDMPQQFAAADLLVCRAGATTLAELTVAGKPAILVPFPQAADDHQRKNAEALARAGAAEMILQKDLDAPALAARIRYYVEHRDALQRMEQNSRALGRPDATERIVDLVEELSGLRPLRLAV
ncbi:MAG: undecaprenyldiphospho-muramoylpentapeptide beta-N-acetylglucosaminyltransferase [Acidobacteria bacterium]|nr:undecaprenyldiphospho-muramoylpentapeptide beta-N-acetylglucosaminyltransferase [Acidobacteriota bacterium]